MTKRLLLMTVLLASLASPQAWAKPKKPVAAGTPSADKVSADKVSAEKTPAEKTPAPARKKSSARPAGDPQQFIAGLSAKLDQQAKATSDLSALHKAIGEELVDVIDFGEMARLTLPDKWDTLIDDQHSEFTGLLTKMVINTYVKRFKPGTPVNITWKQVRPLAGGRFEVQTVLSVKKTSADVNYHVLAADGRWWVFDIVVDDASQVQTYRQNFSKILNKEGWDGLIKRMKKAADKKTT